MNKIIIGAGKTLYDGWIATQENELNLLNENSFKNIFKDQLVDAMLAEHVWEHMTEEEGIIAAKNCYNFIKPGGYIRCAVPDKYFKNEWYQNMVQVGGPGPVDHPAYTHKIVYDYIKFKNIFEKVGFYVELLEYCDENENFHYNYWNEMDGKIGRSYRFDTRNSTDKLKMVSIIIDAEKSLTIENK